MKKFKGVHGRLNIEMNKSYTQHNINFVFNFFEFLFCFSSPLLTLSPLYLYLSLPPHLPGHSHVVGSRRWWDFMHKTRQTNMPHLRKKGEGKEKEKSQNKKLISMKSTTRIFRESREKRENETKIWWFFIIFYLMK